MTRETGKIEQEPMVSYSELEMAGIFPDNNIFVIEQDIRDALEAELNKTRVMEIRDIKTVRGAGVYISYTYPGITERTTCLITDDPLKRQLKAIPGDKLPVRANLRVTGKNNLQLY